MNLPSLPTDSMNARLVHGEIVVVGNKLYMLCRTCHKIVRVNKPLIGSLHLCSIPSTGRTAFAASVSSGASREASKLGRTVTMAVAYLFATPSSLRAYEMSDAALDELANQASVTNWNGYGAAPVDARSLQHADRFLTLLPSSFPSPSISADPDGEVAFEWWGDDDSAFTLSIASNGRLAYAGHFGEERVRNTVLFVDDIPEEILQGIRRTAEPN